MFELAAPTMSITDFAMARCVVPAVVFDLSAESESGMPPPTATLKRWSIMSDNTLSNTWLKVTGLQATLMDTFLMGGLPSPITVSGRVFQPWYTQLPAMGSHSRGVVFGQVRVKDRETLPAGTTWDVLSTLDAPLGTTLTIQADCTLYMMPFAGIQVAGSLSMQASPANPIVLTCSDSTAVDSYMGCTTGLQVIPEVTGVSTLPQCLAHCKTNKAVEALYLKADGVANAKCGCVLATELPSYDPTVTPEICLQGAQASVYAVTSCSPWGVVDILSTADSSAKVTMMAVHLLNGGRTAAKGVLQVERRDLDLSGLVIDSATKAGVAVMATAIKFTLRDTTVSRSGAFGVRVFDGGCKSDCLLTDLIIRNNSMGGVGMESSKTAQLVLRKGLVSLNDTHRGRVPFLNEAIAHLGRA
jgi:hypothetical protein